MVVEIPFARAAAELDGLCERVAAGELVIVRRAGGDLALVAAGELSALLGAVDLVHAPRNAATLLASIRRARERGADLGAIATLRRALPRTS